MPEKITVFEDKKSGTRTVALPIVYPDGSNGCIMICRLKKEDWSPYDMIKSITINYYEN